MNEPSLRVRAPLLDGPVPRHLFRLAAPMVLGVFAMMLFNLVDTLYVSRLGGDALAAMGFTFPVAAFIQSLSLGLMVGTSTVLARLIGGGNRQQVRRITTDALVLSALVIVAVGWAGLATMDPLFKALGAAPHLVDRIREYMVPYYLGIGVLVVPMVGNGAIRATGDTRMPSLIMMIAAGVNLVLDPFLIYGWGPFPRWELRGAAVASILSWCITFVAALLILGRRERMLAPPVWKLSLLLDSWKTVLRIAVPVGLTNMVLPVSGAILTRVLAGFGTAAVAGYAAGLRVEMVSLIGPMALTAGLSPFVGQNAGAGAFDRVREALRTAVRWCWAWCTVVCALALLLAQPLARAFSADPEIIAVTVRYLWMVPWSYGAMTSCFQVTTTLNALNRPLVSACISLLRMFALVVPLAWAGSRWLGVTGVLAGITAGNLIAGLCADAWLRGRLREMAEEPAAVTSPQSGA